MWKGLLFNDTARNHDFKHRKSLSECFRYILESFLTHAVLLWQKKKCILSFGCGSTYFLLPLSCFLPSLTSSLYLNSSSSSERTSFLRLLSSTIRWGEISSSGLWFLRGRQRSSNICYWDVEWWTTPYSMIYLHYIVTPHSGWPTPAHSFSCL